MAVKPLILAVWAGRMDANEGVKSARAGDFRESDSFVESAARVDLFSDSAERIPLKHQPLAYSKDRVFRGLTR